jgi:hypothetical protein
MLLMLAKPERPPQDVDFSTAMVQFVQAEVAALAADWP